MGPIGPLLLIDGHCAVIVLYWASNGSCYCISDECKTHLCFEFISHAILRILYPYSCKTHNISSKLGFVGLLMKSK